MKRLYTIFCFCCLSYSGYAQVVSYDAGELQISIDEKGDLIYLMDKHHQLDYSIQSKRAALLSIMIKDAVLHPEKVIFSKNNTVITLQFPKNIIAVVETISKDRYITFTLRSISNEELIDAVIWGPYETKINKSIGETIGIVQNDSFTIGLQSLNVKTLGGYPWKEDDHLPQMDIFSQENYDVTQKAKRGVLYSVEAAMPTTSGSSLQAYTRNRNKDRIIENWGHTKFVAPAYDDGGLTGSAIAIFGCTTDSTLDMIGKIEIGEGLPHPMIDGVWAKRSRAINSSYLIMNFSEANIDQAISITQKTGFNYLYHSDPFETWGHYPLKKEFFPNGRAGLKACVDKAMQSGIRIGTHTLSNFINTNDSYVSPVPDKRLSVVGSSKIISNIDSTQKDIEIENPDFFNQFQNNHLKSVMIDEEIIRYGSVSEQAPWILKDCQRAAFGTHAAVHAKGAMISKLFDHGYKVFLGNASLNKEIAENIADVFNQTGSSMLDFDGLEGAGSTGMGNYAEALFAKAWYDRLNVNIKSHFLLGASRPGHYFWHIYSRMNWGEPWYAGFRESQTAYRLANQAYFKRNLMPGMLGWFKMTASTTIEDAEWLMARSAGYNAGFAFVTDFSSIQKNGNSDEIFSILKLWEQARLKALFSKDQEKRLQDVSAEFHLEQRSDKSLNLYQVYSNKFKHFKKDRQPGEPLYSTFEFENFADEQILSFMITAEADDISNITIELNQYKKVQLPIVLKKGQTLKFTNGKTLIVYDKNWNKLDEKIIDPALFIINKGKQSINFDCSFDNSESEADAKIEFRLKGKNEIINYQK